MQFRKGRVLSADDIAALKRAGTSSITVARFEAGDVPEDMAASQIGNAMGGHNIEFSAAHTGRTNLCATAFRH